MSPSSSKSESLNSYEAVRREIGALRKVRHPRVVEVFWADKTDAGDWYPEHTGTQPSLTARSGYGTAFRSELGGSCASQSEAVHRRYGN